VIVFALTWWAALQQGYAVYSMADGEKRCGGIYAPESHPIVIYGVAPSEPASRRWAQAAAASALRVGAKSPWWSPQISKRGNP
jgi:hypothetical protein